MEYKIKDKTLKIPPLTVGQVLALGELLKDIEINDGDSAAALLDGIIQEKLPRLMEIIFPGQDAAKIDWLDVEYDLVDEIIEFFFDQSPRLKARLKSLFVSLTRLGNPIS